MRKDGRLELLESTAEEPMLSGNDENSSKATYSSELFMAASASTVLQRQLHLLKLHSWVAGLRSRNMAGTSLCGVVRKVLARWHGTSMRVQRSTVPC